MHKNVIIAAFTIVIMTTIFLSCKKNIIEDTVTDNIKIAVEADQQSRFSKELNTFENDINLLLQSKTALHGKFETEMGALCNVIAIVDSTGANYVLTLTYNGLNCAGTNNFNGSVVVSMLKTTNWKDPGAKISSNFQKLKITRISDNKSITINGTVDITNVSGGKLTDLPTRGSITNTITGSDIQISFNDNTSVTLQEATQRLFTLNNNSVVITTTGTHTEGTVNGIAEWGVDNTGINFKTVYTKPLVMKQDCDYRIGNGEATTTKPDTKFVLTFGLDASGMPTACPGTSGVYYYKTDWQSKNGNVYTALAPY